MGSMLFRSISTQKAPLRPSVKSAKSSQKQRKELTQHKNSTSNKIEATLSRGFPDPSTSNKRRNLSAPVISDNRVIQSLQRAKSEKTNQKSSKKSKLTPEPTQQKSTAVNTFTKTTREKYKSNTDYKNKSPDQLALKLNDELELINKEYVDWWSMRRVRDGKVGLVAVVNVEPMHDFTNKPWYFPGFTRLNAENLLESFKEEGVFLVRPAQSSEEFWSLSVTALKDNQTITRHYRIYKDKTKDFFYIKHEEKFTSLDALIQFYSKPDGEKLRLCYSPPKSESPSGFYDQWEVDPSQIEMYQCIGVGNYGKVYKGVFGKDKTVAVKTVRMLEAEHEKQLEKKKNEFFKELELMKTLHNQHILRLLCVCTKSEPCLLVTEYMSNGSLLKYLSETRDLSLKQLVNMAADVASGMVYLEGLNCVHRDLAARNILVGEKNVVKIADFGLARMMNEKRRYEVRKAEMCAIPVRWTPPEALGECRKYKMQVFSSKSDVWSYGVLLYELITFGRQPYDDMSQEQVIVQVRENNYRLPKPANCLCDENFHRIMLKCWNELPEDRLTFSALFDIFTDYFYRENAYQLNE